MCIALKVRMESNVGHDNPPPARYIEVRAGRDLRDQRQIKNTGHGVATA